MRNGILVLIALCVLSLAAGCVMSDATATAPPTQMPEPIESMEPSTTADTGTDDGMPECPSARGDGTVPPVVSITSITFVVNGLEQIVRGEDMLQASPGDEVRVREVTICAWSFSGDGGEACVDFAPVTKTGQEIESDHRGTHTVRVIPGFMTISVSDLGWTIEDSWSHFSVLLNHWPAEGTEDMECGDGLCERDDRIIVKIQ